MLLVVFVFRKRIIGDSDGTNHLELEFDMDPKPRDTEDSFILQRAKAAMPSLARGGPSTNTSQTEGSSRASDVDQSHKVSIYGD